MNPSFLSPLIRLFGAFLASALLSTAEESITRREMRRAAHTEKVADSTVLTLVDRASLLNAIDAELIRDKSLLAGVIRDNCLSAANVRSFLGDSLFDKRSIQDDLGRQRLKFRKLEANLYNQSSKEVAVTVPLEQKVSQGLVKPEDMPKLVEKIRSDNRLSSRIQEHFPIYLEELILKRGAEDLLAAANTAQAAYYSSKRIDRLAFMDLDEISRLARATAKTKRADRDETIRLFWDMDLLAAAATREIVLVNPPVATDQFSREFCVRWFVDEMKDSPNANAVIPGKRYHSTFVESVTKAQRVLIEFAKSPVNDRPGYAQYKLIQAKRADEARAAEAKAVAATVQKSTFGIADNIDYSKVPDNLVELIKKFSRYDIITYVYSQDASSLSRDRFVTDIYFLKLMQSLSDPSTVAISGDRTLLFELDPQALPMLERKIGNSSAYTARMSQMGMGAMGKMFQNYANSRRSGGTPSLNDGLMDTDYVQFEVLTKAGENDGRLLAVLYSVDKDAFKRIYSGIVKYSKDGAF